MTSNVIKIGITGTHSTGKTTFVENLAKVFIDHDLKVGRIDNLARRALALGFPILTEHTFESTLWIMAECMRQEAEASLICDIILVDRPVLDALGYLDAALEITHRQLDTRGYDELKAIARAHSTDYDVLVMTVLDPAIPLGDGRDLDQEFRAAAATRIEVLISEFALDAHQLTSKNTDKITAAVSEFVLNHPGRKRSA
jgi:GTPase SAR1 family protein